MAALDFPGSPTLNQVFTAAGSSWVWDGAKWMSSSGTTTLLRANNLSDVASVPTSRTNLGLGTMATQNANAVAITGGTIAVTGSSIDGTAIGALTPAAAAFTSLTASGNASFSSALTVNGTATFTGVNPSSTGASAGWYCQDRALSSAGALLYRSGATGRLWMSDYGDAFTFSNAGGCNVATTLTVGTNFNVSGNASFPSVGGSGGFTIGSTASYPLYVHVTAGNNAWILNQVDGMRQWGSGCTSDGSYQIYDMSGGRSLIQLLLNPQINLNALTYVQNDYGAWGAAELRSGTVNSKAYDAVGGTTALTGYSAFNADVQNANSYLILFTKNGRANTVGSITTDGTGIYFNSSSDGRLKKNLRPLAKEIDVGQMIDAIEPVAFEWTSEPDEPTGHGFVAQDLIKVAPKAVRKGFDDAELHPWGVDFSKLVPYMIAEMQQMRARIAELEASHG